MTASSWVNAIARALIALVLAMRRTRIVSTLPSRVGRSGRPSRQSSTRRCVGVDRVGLAFEPAGVAVRSVDLNHLQASSTEMGADPCPVRSGALDPNDHDHAERSSPCLELAVPCRGGVEAGVAEPAADLIDRGGDVGVGVRVDPDRDRHRQRGVWNHRVVVSSVVRWGGTHEPNGRTRQ
jgi:hypothetical protein